MEKAVKITKDLFRCSCILFVSVLIGVTAHAFEISSPVVETQWLADNANQVVILDVRKDLASFQAEGHIPGAILVNWKKVRASRDVNGMPLIKLIPTTEDFEMLMQNSGVNQGNAVVITSHGETYDDVTFCTRLYWTLKYFGHDNVAVLNGGNAKWVKDGFGLSYDESTPAVGNFIGTAERAEILATTEDVLAALDEDDIELVDIRDLNFYLGMVRKSSYVYADGHIPGAKHFAPNLLIDYHAPTVFMDIEILTQALRAIGIDKNKPFIGICNSGHQASGVWFLISEIFGNKKAKLYDGSLHEWTMIGHPVITMEVEEMEFD